MFSRFTDRAAAKVSFSVNGKSVTANATDSVAAAMLAAGMTEHNFGDSEFQILFLVLITLPFAVARSRQV